MLLLAIETSSRQGSIVLHNGGAVIAGREFAHGLQNAARILPLLDEMCREREVAPGQITDVAVSVGPGSFTGLRMGVTLAKTLCFATGAKLIAVPSLPVIALNAPSDATNIMPILDAKRDQVFAAVYRRSQTGDLRSEIGDRGSEMGHSLDEIIAPQLVHLPELLVRAPRPLLILGESIKYHQQHINDETRNLKLEIPNGISNLKSQISDLTVAPESLGYPKASTVALLALILKQQGAYSDPFTLTPVYIRKPEAQERMEAGLLKHLES